MAWQGVGRDIIMRDGKRDEMDPIDIVNPERGEQRMKSIPRWLALSRATT
jgi:hypothetical protein